jgi:hypothetical protein
MANALYDTYRNRQLKALHWAITAATNASPIQITTAGNHNLATGDWVYIQGVLGNTAANGFWVITFVSATQFTLNTSTGNGAYTAGTGVVNNSVDWLGDNIKAVLVDIRGGHYTVALSTDQFLSIIATVDRQDAAAGFTTTSPNLSGKSASAGVAGATATTLPLVAADTRPLGAVVLYMDPFNTGSPSGTQAGLSPLIAYIDTATGLPITPSGGDITLSWQQTTPNIFKL